MSSGTIVVGVTEAPAAHRAVVWAAERARHTHQRVELVAVVGGAVGTVGEGEVVSSAVAGAEQLLETEAAVVREVGVEVATRVERGNPVAHLIDESERASLLVIGSDYQGPDSRAHRGAHGVRIAAAAHCPVVVVPDFDVEERRGVAVGVDGSEISLAAVRFAAAEADRLNEPLIAISAWVPLLAPRNSLVVYPQQYRDAMREAAIERIALSVAGLRQEFPGLEIIERVQEGYPSSVLIQQGEAARMLVVGTRGRGTVARLLLGSASAEVLQRLPTITVVTR